MDTGIDAAMHALECCEQFTDGTTELDVHLRKFEDLTKDVIDILCRLDDVKQPSASIDAKKAHASELSNCLYELKQCVDCIVALKKEAGVHVVATDFTVHRQDGCMWNIGVTYGIWNGHKWRDYCFLSDSVFDLSANALYATRRTTPQSNAFIVSEYRFSVYKGRRYPLHKGIAVPKNMLRGVEAYARQAYEVDKNVTSTMAMIHAHITDSGHPSNV